MQVDRLKSRAWVRRTLYLHHASECVHDIHEGKHRATVELDVRACLRTARHVALGCYRAHVFRVVRAERARRHLSSARMAPEFESELPLSNSSPTGRARLSLAGRSACPVVHFNSEAPEIPPARICPHRSPGGCTSRAPSPPSSCHCVEAHSADALQLPLACKHRHDVRHARKALEARHLGHGGEASDPEGVTHQAHLGEQRVDHRSPSRPSRHPNAASPCPRTPPPTPLRWSQP